jgi:hypothetical protein
MERSVARGHRERLWLKVLNDMQIARFIQFGVNGKNAMCCTNRLGDLCLLLSALSLGLVVGKSSVIKTNA